MKKLLLSILLLLPLAVMAQNVISGGYKFTITRDAAVTVEALHEESLTGVSATASGRGSNGTTNYQTNIAVDKGIAVSGINLTNGVSATYTVTVTGIPAGTEIKRLSIGTNAMNGQGNSQYDGESRTRFVTISATVGGTSTNVVNNVNTEFNKADAPTGGSAPESYSCPFALNTYTLATPVTADGGDLVFSITVHASTGSSTSDPASMGVYVTFKELTLGVDYPVVLSSEYNEKLGDITDAYAKMVAPGDHVKVTGNYFVSTEAKAAANAAIENPSVETIDAAYGHLTGLTEQPGICDDNLYIINNSNSKTSGTIFVNSTTRKLRGTVANTAAVTDNYDKWMIIATSNTDEYMLYNVGAKGVANCDVVTASDAGGGADNVWDAINEFDGFNRGYVVMESKNPQQWRIRDSQVDGLNESNKDQLRCYMNNNGDNATVTVWQQDGTQTGNTNSLFYLYYMGKATAQNVSEAAAMKCAIEHPKVNAPIGTATFATLHNALGNMIVPEHVEAWTFTGNADGITAVKSYVTGDVIPAGTGVLLKSLDDYDAESNGDFVVTATEATTDPGDANLLKGGDAPADLSNVYYLSNGSEGVGFYKAQEGFTNGAHKAYLLVSGANVRGFAFSDLFGSTENGIESAEADARVSVGYDLSGRRVSQPARGLYIVNGKKYIYE